MDTSNLAHSGTHNQVMALTTSLACLTARTPEPDRQTNSLPELPPDPFAEHDQQWISALVVSEVDPANRRPARTATVVGLSFKLDRLQRLAEFAKLKAGGSSGPAPDPAYDAVNQAQGRLRKGKPPNLTPAQAMRLVPVVIDVAGRARAWRRDRWLRRTAPPDPPKDAFRAASIMAVLTGRQPLTRADRYQWKELLDYVELRRTTDRPQWRALLEAMYKALVIRAKGAGLSRAAYLQAALQETSQALEAARK